MVKEKHTLHKIIGKLLDKLESKIYRCEVIKDSACRKPFEKDGALTLYFSKIKCAQNKYCNVDLLLLKNDRIKVIIEIEESDIPPIKICGKFLASALSLYYIHESRGNKLIVMNPKGVLFVQIIDKSKLKEKGKKVEQFKNLKKSIQDVLPIKGSKITDYELFIGNKKDFKNKKNGKGKELIKHIKKFIGNQK